jgi:hypothetical protein
VHTHGVGVLKDDATVLRWLPQILPRLNPGTGDRICEGLQDVILGPFLLGQGALIL